MHILFVLLFIPHRAQVTATGFNWIGLVLTRVKTRAYSTRQMGSFWFKWTRAERRGGCSPWRWPPMERPSGSGCSEGFLVQRALCLC